VNQPGTSQTLDPLDGRIDWAPEIGGGGFIWFTHGADLGGFPAIRYGAISVSSNTATVANAFHSPSSDDFNPSLAVRSWGQIAAQVTGHRLGPGCVWVVRPMQNRG
jgi:hypothetical protein